MQPRFSKESARSVIRAFKAVEKQLFWVALALAAVLGVLYTRGVIEQLWLVAFPIGQHLALSAAIGAYYGSNVAPDLIAEGAGSDEAE